MNTVAYDYADIRLSQRFGDITEKFGVSLAMKPACSAISPPYAPKSSQRRRCRASSDTSEKPMRTVTIHPNDNHLGLYTEPPACSARTRPMLLDRDGVDADLTVISLASCSAVSDVTSDGPTLFEGSPVASVSSDSDILDESCVDALVPLLPSVDEAHSDGVSHLVGDFTSAWGLEVNNLNPVYIGDISLCSTCCAFLNVVAGCLTLMCGG